MARPKRPQTVVKAKLSKKLNAANKLVQAKKRRKTASTIARIKAKYSNLS